MTALLFALLAFLPICYVAVYIERRESFMYQRERFTWLGR